MTAISTIPWTADGELEVLSFGLGGETFAIEAVRVEEILDLLPETEVPGAGALIGHVINFRGRVIPLADLRPAFGMAVAAPTRDSRIVVVSATIDAAVEPIGLRADKVEEVTTLSAADCEPPPAIGLRWPRGHVRALARRGEDIVVLPEIDAILAGHRRSPR